jgi:hypothetical protein
MRGRDEIQCGGRCELPVDLRETRMQLMSRVKKSCPFDSPQALIDPLHNEVAAQPGVQQ